MNERHGVPIGREDRDARARTSGASRRSSPCRMQGHGSTIPPRPRRRCRGAVRPRTRHRRGRTAGATSPSAGHDHAHAGPLARASAANPPAPITRRRCTRHLLRSLRGQRGNGRVAGPSDGVNRAGKRAAVELVARTLHEARDGIRRLPGGRRLRRRARARRPTASSSGRLRPPAPEPTTTVISPLTGSAKRIASSDAVPRTVSSKRFVSSRQTATRRSGSTRRKRGERVAAGASATRTRPPSRASLRLLPERLELRPARRGR